MALSQSVTDALEDAKSSIRNALAYAARNERPSTCERIAKLLSDIETVGLTDSLMDSLEDIKNGKTDGENPFGNFGFGMGGK